MVNTRNKHNRHIALCKGERGLPCASKRQFTIACPDAWHRDGGCPPLSSREAMCAPRRRGTSRLDYRARATNFLLCLLCFTSMNGLLATCGHSLKKIFADSELQGDSAIRKFRITAPENGMFHFTDEEAEA